MCEHHNEKQTRCYIFIINTSSLSKKAFIQFLLTTVKLHNSWPTYNIDNTAVNAVESDFNIYYSYHSKRQDFGTEPRTKLDFCAIDYYYYKRKNIHFARVRQIR